jgi:catechol 2,3-dioxygenase-like lactoylglutathione lyase family enzyme
MNHFTVLAKDLAATKEFYTGVLGLSEGFRPDLGFPGAWLYAGKEAVLHIIAGRPLPADPRGVLDLWFSARDLPGRRPAKGARYCHDLRRQNESGVWQLFCFDPNGARVELDFGPTEPAPSARARDNGLEARGFLPCADSGRSRVWSQRSNGVAERWIEVRRNTKAAVDSGKYVGVGPRTACEPLTLHGVDFVPFTLLTVATVVVSNH